MLRRHRADCDGPMLPAARAASTALWAADASRFRRIDRCLFHRLDTRLQLGPPHPALADHEVVLGSL
jgi:hypothetical protein